MKQFNSNKHKMIDLFAGCGGLSLGFKLAGFEEMAAVEYDKYASTTFKANFSAPVITSDITLEATKQDLYGIVEEQLQGERLDVLCGGFPCQGFSSAGLRNPDDPRNRLVFDMLEVVRYLNPRVIVGENVPGLKTMENGQVLRRIINELESLGYVADYRILNAADFAVPQERERVIIIANNIGKWNIFPTPLLQRSEYVTVGDAIGDLMSHPFDTSFSHVPAKHQDYMVRNMTALPQGGHLYGTRNSSYRRLSWNKPSFTMTSNNGAPAIHPIEPRYITSREMARLQSFPDSFDFSRVGKTLQMKQIGNAVPPLLAQAVATAVHSMLVD